MGDPNCYTCDYCLENCSACPDGNITRLRNGQIDGGNLYTMRQGLSVLNSRRKRIWKQSRMSSSQGLLRKRSLFVSQMVGQGSCPTALGEAGGPGDLQSAIQKSNYPPAIGKAAGYNMGHLRNRVAYRNQSGVDRKHDSYQRYLARKVGGVFRKEQQPNIVGRTSWRGQPRTRTGSNACCKRPTHSKICESICVQATITVGTDGQYYGYTGNGYPWTNPTGSKDNSCENLSQLTRLYWDDTLGQFNTYYGNGQEITFTNITIWDNNGNSIIYTRGDSTYTDNDGYTWDTDRPSWIYGGAIIEASLEAPCCNNRVPNCDDTSKFTGRAVLLGGNVKNRTCVAQRCQCPNCP